MSEEMKVLTPDELEKVTGGSMKTVKFNGAEVREGAGKQFRLITVLRANTQVTFTGTVQYNDEEGCTWLSISRPVGWIRLSDCV